MLVFLLGIALGFAIASALFILFLFQINDIPISIKKIIFTAKTQYNLLKLINSNKAFRLTINDLKDAFPRDKYPSDKYPYIKYLPSTYPSLEYQLFDDINYSAKINAIKNEKKAPTHEEIIQTSRMNMIGLGFLCGSASSKCNIIDNIYLNKDIKFAVLSYKGSNIKNGIIVYSHGGGHVSGNHHYPFSMLSMLSRLTGCIAISVDYKLCPEYTITDSVNDILNVYKWIINSDQIRSENKMSISDNVPNYLLNLNDLNINKKIIFSGDSAGGNLCLLAIQAINNDNKIALPCCAWPISPMTNLNTEPFDSSKRNKMKDNMINRDHMKNNFNVIAVGNMFKKINNPNDPKYSSVNGKMKGLCPLLFTVGACEILLDDTLIAANKAYTNGVDVTVEIEPYLCHVYPIFVNVFPEAKYAVIRAATFMNKHLKNN